MKKANQTNNNQLTIYEFVATAISIVVGISVLSLPNAAVGAAHQDGWIATALGSIYPLYVTILASFIITLYPNTSIMELSIQFTGKFFGNILNILFMVQFLYYAVGVLAAAANLLQVYSVWFMSKTQIILIFVVLVIYLSLKDLKVLSRINLIAFIMMLILLTTTSTAFKYGSLLNIEPILNTNIKDILKGTKESAFSYAGMEGILIIHPYVKDKQKLIKASFITVGIITFFYTWSVFTSTLYLGPDIIPKALWPVNYVTESVKIPAINNFRFILLILWPIIIYKTVMTEHYLCAEIMNKVIKLNIKKWCIILSPVLLIGPMFFQNEVSRRDFYGNYTFWIALYSVLYVTLITIIAVIKSKSTKKVTAE
jgi:spore germination protein (amino acid permease)